MADFTEEDLSGSLFERVDLTDAEFRAADLSRARFRGVDLNGVVMRGVELVDVRIDAEIQNLVINGVDVAPLVNAELDRRDPDRARMAPPTPPASGKRGTSSNGAGTARWNGLAASTPSSCNRSVDDE